MKVQVAGPAPRGNSALTHPTTGPAAALGLWLCPQRSLHSCPLRASQTRPPPGKPSPSPRAPGSVLEGPSLLLPHSREHRGLPWGGGGRANRPRKTSPTFSPASCCSGRTSLRAPAGPPWPERTRKCRKEPKGPREGAGVAAGPGLPLCRQVWASRRPLVHVALRQ